VKKKKAIHLGNTGTNEKYEDGKLLEMEAKDILIIPVQASKFSSDRK